MSKEQQDNLVFVALGGQGEIGRNAALYGFGPPRARKWILVDCGVSFAGPDFPGVDLMLPDLSYVESIKKDLLGLIITHAHEDHIGALSRLWPRLNCKVFATRFAIGLLEARQASEPGAPKIDLVEIKPRTPFQLGPFEIEPVSVAHSIPESCALAIRTPVGLALHTGDWKLDAEPGIGPDTDAERLRELGAEGVAAVICDSTNIVREGRSPSEGDVARTLKEIIGVAKNRVVVTTFASNLARVRAVAMAAQEAGRSVVIVGRALERVVNVGRECGYLDGAPTFLSMQNFPDLARENCVVIATGSQGEERAAIARIATKDHPVIKLAKDDQVIFSSRTIPGNERAVNAIINGLIDQGIEVITDREKLVHCSGHPRRDEVGDLYDWVKPAFVLPTHGEALHLKTQADFARARGIASRDDVRNGDMVRLAPGPVEKLTEVPHGVWLADGDVLIGADDEALNMRRRLSFAGVVSIGVAVTAKGDLAGDPDVLLSGLPRYGRDRQPLDALVDDVIFQTIDNLPRGRRRDADGLANALERAVRSAVGEAWGKKPQVLVMVIEV